MATMTIGQLARDGGVGVETIRFYQRRGLIALPERTGGARPDGGIRRYGAGDARRLRFIRSAQAAGFTLDEIGELLALDGTQDRARARDLARRRLVALDAKIAELAAARTALRRLADACGATTTGRCPDHRRLRGLTLAAHGRGG